MRFDKPARKAKKVQFQEKLDVIRIENRGVWHSAEHLKMLKERALEMGRTAHQDRRIDLWNATFQDPVSFGMLCMWTTDYNSLRGLEKFVCAQHRHRRMAEHRDRVKAVMNAQAFTADKVSVELSEISRFYSHASRIMAEQIGQADQFAVAADDLKSKRMDLIRGMMVSGGPHPQLAAMQNGKYSSRRIVHPSSECSPDFNVRMVPTTAPSAA